MVALPSRSILLHLGRQMGWRKIFRWIYDFSPKIATSNSCPSNKGWISNHATGKSAMAPRILSNVLTWMGGKLPPLTLHKKGVVKIQWFLGAEDFHSFFYLGSVFGLNHRGQFFHPFFKPHLRITFFSISKISFRKKVEKFKRGNQWDVLVTYFLQHETCCQGENVHWTNECTDAMDTFDDDIDYKWLHTRIK